MIRTFNRTITRVILANASGHEIARVLLTNSDRFAAILTACRAVAPKGYRYAETIG